MAFAKQAAFADRNDQSSGHQNRYQKISRHHRCPGKSPQPKPSQMAKICKFPI
jgi:hypothetical protein